MSTRTLYYYSCKSLLMTRYMMCRMSYNLQNDEMVLIWFSVGPHQEAWRWFLAKGTKLTVENWVLIMSEWFILMYNHSTVCWRCWLTAVCVLICWPIFVCCPRNHVSVIIFPTVWIIMGTRSSLVLAQISKLTQVGCLVLLKGILLFFCPICFYFTTSYFLE